MANNTHKLHFQFDPKLREYATDRQWELLLTIEQHGSERRAADALGCARSLFYQAKRVVMQNAVKHGYAPDYDMIHPVPDGMKVKGISTLYDETGESRMQWVKTSADKERQEQIFREACEAMAETLPRMKPVKEPDGTESELCNLYTISDYHMGMLVRNGDEKWDIEIATNTLLKCFQTLMDGAPKAETAVIAELGDFLHTDGLVAVTPAGKNVLEPDGSFDAIVRATIIVLRQVAAMALAKHKHVHFIFAEGNHDPASSVFLRQMFAALFENEPRITIDDSELPYYAYKHGRTMLAFHHGHIKKMVNLVSLFAAQYPVMWGETTKRYAHCGHLHHLAVKEDQGMTVTQHPTLAARDSYVARGGWHAQRRAICVTYHKEFGEVGSNHVTPEMVG